LIFRMVNPGNHKVNHRKRLYSCQVSLNMHGSIEEVSPTLLLMRARSSAGRAADHHSRQSQVRILVRPPNPWVGKRGRNQPAHFFDLSTMHPVRRTGPRSPTAWAAGAATHIAAECSPDDGERDSQLRADVAISRATPANAIAVRPSRACGGMMTRFANSLVNSCRMTFR
jgi:hypothetical protein